MSFRNFQSAISTAGFSGFPRLPSFTFFLNSSKVLPNLPYSSRRNRACQPGIQLQRALERRDCDVEIRAFVEVVKPREVVLPLAMSELGFRAGGQAGCRRHSGRCGLKCVARAVGSLPEKFVVIGALAQVLTSCSTARCECPD